jgi:hypothetical protein
MHKSVLGRRFARGFETKEESGDRVFCFFYGFYGPEIEIEKPEAL